MTAWDTLQKLLSLSDNDVGSLTLICLYEGQTVWLPAQGQSSQHASLWRPVESPSMHLSIHVLHAAWWPDVTFRECADVFFLLSLFLPLSFFHVNAWKRQKEQLPPDAAINKSMEMSVFLKLLHHSENSLKHDEYHFNWSRTMLDLLKSSWYIADFDNYKYSLLILTAILILLYYYNIDINMKHLLGTGWNSLPPLLLHIWCSRPQTTLQ